MSSQYLIYLVIIPSITTWHSWDAPWIPQVAGSMRCLPCISYICSSFHPLQALLECPMHATSSWINAMSFQYLISGHNSIHYHHSWDVLCIPQEVGSMRCPPSILYIWSKFHLLQVFWDALCIPQVGGSMRCPPSISYIWS